MSEITIYEALRAGGLSPAGACAMLGNMFCESALISNNVQNNCPMGDSDYTYNVDNGLMTRWQFMSDSYGYGLCQWTYSGRKDHLYMFAREKGVSIGDEQMQCQFCLEELQRDYAELYQYLCQTEDLPKATERICAEYERPAVNNFADRINAAQRFFNQQVRECCSNDSCQIDLQTEPPAELCEISARVLRQSDLGRDVFLLQCGLNDMGISCGVPDGDFGLNTVEAVRELQRKIDQEPTGIADQNVWMAILKKR